MKKYICLLIIGLWVGCASNEPVKQPDNISDCTKVVRYHNLSICLPYVKGMTECWLTSGIRERLDIVNGDTSRISFGYYLPDSALNVKDENRYNESIWIWSGSSLLDTTITVEHLDFFSKMMIDNYEKFWSEGLDKLPSSDSIGVSIESPLFIESYSPNNTNRSMVSLFRSDNINGSYVGVQILNICIIKDRAIFYAYSLPYKNEQSIKQAKFFNDNFGLKFLEANR